MTAAAIAEYHRGWDGPWVEDEIFGTHEPRVVAHALAELLGSEATETVFYEVSVGVVAGLVLADGRRVVVKAHRPNVSLSYLEATTGVQCSLADAGLPVPRPLAAPRPFGRGCATIEELLDDGERGDAHDPRARTAMARMLAKLVETAPHVDGLHGGMLDDPESLWPEPHSKLFDFEATRDGTEWIDEFAERARSEPAGGVVVGHGDWSVKHFRFVGNEITAIYDWDSLIRADEPRIVGQAAATFPATWYLPVAVLATPDESRAFVAEYEEARGRAFNREERVRLAHAAAYVVAYGARCESCGDPGATSFERGSQRDTLARHGEEFLRL
jgi:hypothetical protein